MHLRSLPVRSPIPHASPVRPPSLSASERGERLSLAGEQRELTCSLIGLGVKVCLALVVGVSLCRVAVAYQERMERQGELAAVLDIEQAKLNRARERFDQLFTLGGEQRLVREQQQWIAPNRLRVVWRESQPPAFPSVEHTGPVASTRTAAH
ncbi:MAG: hypothetical protein VKN13_04685 [Cyanobacteriota bacterium]|nr:hypothetical protein [Cyanobacteriota bacterium]